MRESMRRRAADRRLRAASVLVDDAARFDRITGNRLPGLQRGAAFRIGAAWEPLLDAVAVLEPGASARTRFRIAGATARAPGSRAHFARTAAVEAATVLADSGTTVGAHRTFALDRKARLGTGHSFPHTGEITARAHARAGAGHGRGTGFVTALGEAIADVFIEGKASCQTDALFRRAIARATVRVAGAGLEVAKASPVGTRGSTSRAAVRRPTVDGRCAGGSRRSALDVALIIVRCRSAARHYRKDCKKQHTLGAAFHKGSH